FAGFRRRGRTTEQLGADLQAHRSNDVPFLAVLVFQKREAGRAHGIVFNGRHRCLDAVLVPLEIHVADFLLVAPANAARGDAPVHIAPARFLAGEHQAFFGPALGDFVVRRDRDVSRGRREWSVNFERHNAVQVRMILSPSFRVTMAFFQSRVLPACAVRWRRALPRTFSVFTLSTLTLNNSWTAWRIWILFARRSATTVYWFSLSPCLVPFSVRRTVLTISKEFMAVNPCPDVPRP